MVRLRAPQAWAIWALTGCGGMTINGDVVDARGKPVSGANVTAAGTLCTTTTDAEGKFSLGCEPGTHIVVISAAGFTTEEFTTQATASEAYATGTHKLIRVPAEKGLHLFVNDDYTQMTPGRVHRILLEQGKVTHRLVCLDRDHSTPNIVPAGEVLLFDYEHPGWRPFRLDDEGCAYRDTRDEQQRWTEVYKVKPPYEVKEYNRGRSLAVLQMEPGDYFIADWKGFFVGANDREEKFSYTGYWVKAR